MTITSPYTPASFNGSGTTGPFSFTFRILDKTNIKVEKVVGTTVTTLTEGVGAGQYSIVLVAAGLSGGQITLGTALAIGERLIVSRVTPRTQLEKLADLRRFNAEIHERAFDKATMVIQETEQIGSSAVKFPTADTPGLNQTLPVDSARANKVMGFNSSGEPVASALNLSDLDGFAAAAAAVQVNKDATDANVITTGNNATAAQNAQAAAEAAAAGMKWRPSVRASTTAALPTVTYNNGTSGFGATLTATANGALAAQDGITLTVGQRLLVKDQAAQLQNGVYTLTQVGTGGTPFILTRAVDADSWTELVSQAISIEEGTTLADLAYICTVNQGGIIGTTNVTWVPFNPPLVIASQAEAEGNTENTKAMSSLRVYQQVTNRIASQAEAQAGTDNTKMMTPLRVKEASGLVLLDTKICSGQSTIDFTQYINNTYDKYIFELVNVKPSVDAYLSWVTSTNGGSSYDTGASDYAVIAHWGYTVSGTPGSSFYRTASASAVIPFNAQALESSGGFGCCGQVELYNPADTANIKSMIYRLSAYINTPEYMHIFGQAERLATADIDAVRFQLSAGNFASGKIKLYGQR